MYEVSRWAGHSSLNFTDRVYTHIAEKPDYTQGAEGRNGAAVPGRRRGLIQRGVSAACRPRDRVMEPLGNVVGDLKEQRHAYFQFLP